MNLKLLFKLIVLFFSHSLFAHEKLDSLIRFHEQVEFYLSLNAKMAEERYQCLTKHNIVNTTSASIQATDPVCYKVIKKLIDFSGLTLHQFRVYKSLLQPSFATFRSMTISDLNQLDEKFYIASALSYDVQFNRISTPIKNLRLKSDSYSDPMTGNAFDSFDFTDELDQQIKPQALTEIERNQARSLFYKFWWSSCETFEKNLIETNIYEYKTSQLKFCSLMKSKQTQLITNYRFGKYLLEDYLKFQKNNYEFKFRESLQLKLQEQLNTWPALVFIRGPEFFKADMQKAQNISRQITSQLIAYRRQKFAEINLDNRIATYKQNKMSEQEQAMLIEDLFGDLKFENISDAYAFNSPHGDQLVFEELRADSVKKDNFEKKISVGVTLGVLATCLAPLNGKIAAAGSRIILPLLAQTGIQSLKFLNRAHFLTGCGALGTLYDLYSTNESIQDFKSISDLFFSQGNGTDLFVSYKKLKESEREIINNILLLPLNIAEVKLGLSQISSLSESMKKRLVHYAESRAN